MSISCAASSEIANQYEHLLECLNLLDEVGRKRSMKGIADAVKSLDVIDMMRRYEVAMVYESR